MFYILQFVSVPFCCFFRFTVILVFIVLFLFFSILMFLDSFP